MLEVGNGILVQAMLGQKLVGQNLSKNGNLSTPQAGEVLS